MNRVDMDKVREKSIRQCEFFIELVEKTCAGSGFSLVTPRESKNRGSQVSFGHQEGYAIMQALITDKVIGDFRAPDIVRFGITPLYLRYVDIWDGVMRLKNIMEKELWKNPSFQQRLAVT